MSNNKYAIFLDIDGTLMINGIIPHKNIVAIEQARQLGHTVFINTGRSYSYIPKKIFDEIYLDGVVAGIGSYVRFGDEIIQSITINKNLLKKVADHFFSAGAPCVFEGEKEIFYLNVDNHGDKLIVKHSNDFSTVYKDARISKITVGRALFDEEIKMLEKYFSVYNHPNYSEFALKGCTKSNGMKVMLERLGLKRENCIAIGDSVNDLDMLKYAGISIAMGNSTDEVKQLCDFVSETAENAGVAVALQKFVY